jgi:outer membrane protein TolC
MNIFRCILPVLFFVSSLPIIAQDKVQVFRFADFLGQVITEHPLAKKAALQTRLARAEKMRAKGFFDPVLQAAVRQKDFKDKLYYRYFQTGVKVPTALGIDLTGGYENNGGQYLSPEYKTDKYGVWNLGLEANVLQGLWVNERNTAKKQAAVFQQLAKNEQQQLINQLILSAAAAYLNWQKYSLIESALNENKSLAAAYLENTKQAFFSGEKTAIDTLEAFILEQDALALFQKYKVERIKAVQTLENHLWLDNSPQALKEGVQPEATRNNSVIRDIDFKAIQLNTHPIILEKQYKLRYYKLEQRLKREKLKPKLKLKYNPLLSTASNSIRPNFTTNNFKWGLQLSTPLLLRKERAAIQKGQVKIESLEFELTYKLNELSNKIEASWKQQDVLLKQYVLLQNNVLGYKKLMQAEGDKFQFGESSVFLLNKRREKYISGQIKLAEVQYKQQGKALEYLYHSNQLMPLTQ